MAHSQRSPIARALRAAAAAAAIAAAVLSAPAAANARCQAGADVTIRVDHNWPATTAGASPALSRPSSGAMFSPMVCAVHSASWSMWAMGSSATAGVQSVAETGSPTTLVSELNAARTAGNVEQFFVASGPAAVSATTTATVTLTGAISDPRLSCVSMIAPSPDWFIGISSVPLCERLGASEWTATSRGYDSGTDSGATFEAANSATSPRGTIALASELGTTEFATFRLSAVAGVEAGAGATVAARFAFSRPSGVPTNVFVTPMVCAVHTADYTMWEAGEMASAGATLLAETGNTTLLEQELRAVPSGRILTWATFEGQGFNARTPTLTLPSTAVTNPLLSCMAMLAPSPDWFVGVHSLPLRRAATLDTAMTLMSYDAGTEEGTGWSLDNAATSPLQNIAARSAGGTFGTVTVMTTASAAGGVAGAVVLAASGVVAVFFA